jgi:hypothetical protein
LTIQVADLPLTDFLRLVATETAISVAASDQLLSKRVTVDLKDQPIDQVLGVVARQLGAEVSRVGDLYFVGELAPEDLGVLVRRSRRLDREGVQASVAGFLSPHGSVQTFTDGLLVVADRVEVLRRVSEALDEIESAEAVTWCVQLHILSLTDSDLRDFGLDVEPALELAYTYSSVSGALAGVVEGVEAVEGLRGGLDAGLSAMLRATAERESVRSVAEPLFLIVDGEKGEFVRGQKLPVTTSVVNGETGQVTERVQFIQTGLQINVTPRELSDRVCRVVVDVSLSDAVSGTEGQAAPTTQEQQFKASSDVAVGGVYLLGALRVGEWARKHETALRFGARVEASDVHWLIWCRVYRVALNPVGPAGAEAAATERPEATEPGPEAPAVGAEHERASDGSGQGEGSEGAAGDAGVDAGSGPALEGDR